MQRCGRSMNDSIYWVSGTDMCVCVCVHECCMLVTFALYDTVMSLSVCRVHHMLCCHASCHIVLHAVMFARFTCHHRYQR